MSESILLRDALAQWQAEFGKPVEKFSCGALARMPVAPGRIVMVGAPPGTGKTALAMQLTFNALYQHENLRAVVCNVEMTSGDLLFRELARLTGLPLDALFNAQSTGNEKIESALEKLKQIENRMAFMLPPFSLKSTAQAASELNAELIVLDYIQRIPTEAGKQQEIRLQLNEAMGIIRRLANEHGKAVVVISAVGRGDGNYKGLGLGSFKESSELEFAVDDAYVLQPCESNPAVVTLRHVKARHGKRQDILLGFQGEFQRFYQAEGTA